MKWLLGLVSRESLRRRVRFARYRSFRVDASWYCFWVNTDGAPFLSPPEVFGARRSRLIEALSASGGLRAILSAGWPRTRNFGHNLFPFRAESHFLYLVGRHIEGALLTIVDGRACLYAPEPDPEMELWAGPQRTLASYEDELGLEVRPISELPSGPFCTLPPQDEETALWLGELIERELEPQSGGQLTGDDATLADAMVGLRLVHDEAGIQQLRYAAMVSSEAHLAGMRTTRGASREAQIRGRMEGKIGEFGLAPAYTSIVTTQGQILHAAESLGTLAPGQMLLCDVGAETREGFAGDITRTWPVAGAFSSTQDDLYSLVLFIQKEAIERVRAGVNFLDIHRATVRRLGEGLAQLGILKGALDELYDSGAISVFFPHGLGHLLGVDVHDMEDLGDRAGYGPQERSTHPAEIPLRMNRDLAANMVVTIEPGFYQVPLLLKRARANRRVNQLIQWDRLAQFSDVSGIRIEDDVRVTEGAPEVLSRDCPKEKAALQECLEA